MNPVIEFEPVAVQRPWGGRRLAETFGKKLPPELPYDILFGERGPQPVGEMWEVSDRLEVQSIVRAGSLAGQSLHDLWKNRRAEIFGEAYTSYPAENFPLLIKLLDARKRLSLQVHPTAETCKLLGHGSEPKTEMWYFVDCDETAKVFLGLKPGTTRETFIQAMNDGIVESLLNAVPVKKHDALFVPSGRIHAICEGIMLIEVQQNSDTTYRVHHWNQYTAPNGKPIALNIEESLASLDFSDTAPTRPNTITEPVRCPYFEVQAWHLDTDPPLPRDLARFAIYAIADGTALRGDQTFSAGSFFLAPAGVAADLRATSGTATALQITLPCCP